MKKLKTKNPKTKNPKTENPKTENPKTEYKETPFLETNLCGTDAAEITYDNIVDVLAEMNEDAITYDGYEDALVGICERFGMPSVAAYDQDKCLDILQVRDGMSYEEASEYFDYNSVGAWSGDSTPVFVTLMRNVAI